VSPRFRSVKGEDTVPLFVGPARFRTDAHTIGRCQERPAPAAVQPYRAFRADIRSSNAESPGFSSGENSHHIFRSAPVIRPPSDYNSASSSFTEAAIRFTPSTMTSSSGQEKQSRKCPWFL